MKRPVFFWLLLGVSALLFAAAFALWRHGPLFVSPDETANFFFARTFAQTGRLWTFDALNAALGDALHPRSMIALGGRLVPVGFWGLPLLYGSVAAVLGAWSIAWLTPVLAVLALWAWAALCRRLFGERLGWTAALLLALHPAWWYYAARGLMPNVPFTAGLIFSAFFLVVRPWPGRAAGWVNGALAGASLGLALLIRPAEAVWVGLMLVAGAWLARRFLTKQLILGFTLAAALVLSALPLVNQRLYGSPWSFGYTAQVVEAEAGIEPAAPPTWRTRVESALSPVFPFGIHPRRMLREFGHYGISLFWWMPLLAVLGAALFVRRTMDADQARTRRAYLALAAGAAAWLVVMYGSWSFNDNPDPSQITLGNSHVRYWLPIFVLATPLAAAAVEWALQRVRGKARWALGAAGIAVGLALCIWSAFFQSQDSLLASRAVLGQSAAIRQRVGALTELNAVIVVDRADKILFPLRRVRYPLRDEATYALMSRIAAVVPLYYYGITFPPRDIAYLNDEKLKGLGLRIEPVETFGIETLYRIQETE